MTIHREAAAAVTARNGCIYVIGGDTTQTGTVTTPRKVDVYHPSTDTWTLAPPMVLARRSLAAAAGPQNIYAIGGYNLARGALASTERFPSHQATC